MYDSTAKRTLTLTVWSVLGGMVTYVVVIIDRFGVSALTDPPHTIVLASLVIALAMLSTGYFSSTIRTNLALVVLRTLKVVVDGLVIASKGINALFRNWLLLAIPVAVLIPLSYGVLALLKSQRADKTRQDDIKNLQRGILEYEMNASGRSFFLGLADRIKSSQAPSPLDECTQRVVSIIRDLYSTDKGPEEDFSRQRSAILTKITPSTTCSNAWHQGIEAAVYVRLYLGASGEGRHLAHTFEAHQWWQKAKMGLSKSPLHNSEHLLTTFLYSTRGLVYANYVVGLSKSTSSPFSIVLDKYKAEFPRQDAPSTLKFATWLVAQAQADYKTAFEAAAHIDPPRQARNREQNLLADLFVKVGPRINTYPPEDQHTLLTQLSRVIPADQCRSVKACAFTLLKQRSPHLAESVDYITYAQLASLGYDSYKSELASNPSLMSANTALELGLKLGYRSRPFFEDLETAGLCSIFQENPVRFTKKIERYIPQIDARAMTSSCQ